MSWSLIGHAQRYQLSPIDCLLSFGTCMSGAPYALRHLDMARQGVHAGLHYTIAAIQFTPILGALAAAVDAVAAFVYAHFFLRTPQNAPINIVGIDELPAAPTIDMIQNIEISQTCQEQTPCMHTCKILLSDGREKQLTLDAFSIHTFFISTLLNKIKWSGQTSTHSIADHFKGYVDNPLGPNSTATATNKLIKIFA